MIKEAGFQWPISHGESASLFLVFFASCLLCFSVSLFLCFLSSLLLCLLFLLVSLAEFLYLVSGISAGFQQDCCGISAGFSIIHKSVDKCTENPFNNFLITCGISTFPYLHPRDYGYPQGY